MTRVLILDDNSGNLFLNARILRQLGCEVTEVTDPVKALDLLRSGQAFDVVFIDLYMPVMSGFHFLEKAKAIYPKMPMVITSVLAQPNAEIIAISKGANLCMFEKYTEEDFAEALRRLFPEKSF